MPERIQLRRTKGWRLPPGAVNVARPTKWGNPFTIAEAIEAEYAHNKEDGRKFVTEVFADWLSNGDLSTWWFSDGAERHRWMIYHMCGLRGRDLACWCPLEDKNGNRIPCHADVLLEIANS